MRRSVMGLVPIGHLKAPWRTCSNAGVCTLYSMKISTNGGKRKGVWLACVNLQPNSAKHISSNSALDLEVWHADGLCWLGSQT